MSPVEDHESELLRILEERLLPPGTLDDPDLRDRAVGLLRDALDAASRTRRAKLLKAAELEGADPPDELVSLLGKVVGLAGLYRWALAHEPEGLGTLGDLSDWLVRPHPAPTERELAAGRRAGLDIATDEDETTIDARLGHYLRSKKMPEKYDFDPRALPVGVDGEDLEKEKIDQIVAVLGEVSRPVGTFVLGALSLDGRLLEQDAGVLGTHIRLLRNETEGSTPSIERGGDGQPKALSNVEALERIAVAFDRIRRGDGDVSYYEEFAFVARALIANARNVPIDSSGLEGRVLQQLTLYVPGQFGGTLSLPEFEAPSVAGSDLVADNMRAVALVYAAWNLEELKLFQVLDRVVEVFMNGQLPVGFDNGGRALADYYFSDDEKKISEAGRRMTYSRVLGVPGGEVSKEAPPNRAFGDLFLRFLSSVSEFDRQRRIADVVSGGRPYDALSLTAEQVRKSGRDLAANMTLYGYGGTFFVAQKLKDQIARALTVLSVPEILSAYGVQSPFQVVERVAASDLGGTVPNILRHRTMAESGKAILDIVADSIPAWLGSARPLFEPRAGDVGGIGAGNGNGARRLPPDIPHDRELLLMRHTEHWLAVNGIKDEQRARLGEPELIAATPSIPKVGADGGAAFDQLRQLVATGQAPSLDQLKALLPDMGQIARV